MEGSVFQKNQEQRSKQCSFIFQQSFLGFFYIAIVGLSKDYLKNRDL